MDDDDYNIYCLKILLKLLKVSKNNINVALNGLEALEKVEETVNKHDSCYKLILMDINMPNMDGFECTKILNKQMDEGKIPEVTIISCTTDDHTQNENFSLFKGHIQKPI